MVNMTFISASNIERKVQKVEGSLGMPMSHLVETAFEISNGRYQV